MKKTSKVLSVILAVLMITVMFPVSAFAGSVEQTILGDSTVDEVTIVVTLPTDLDFALDPLELNVTGNQIYSPSYFFVNKTEAPVKIAIDFEADLAAQVSLVDNPDTLDANDTEVTTKELYFGAFGATGVTVNDLDFDYVMGAGADPVGIFDLEEESLISALDPVTMTTSISFALAKATASDDEIDTLAAQNKGVATFEFYGKMNTYANWTANDIEISGTFTLTALSATTYSGYTPGGYLAEGFNQLGTDIPVTTINVTSAGDVATMIDSATLQMSAAVLPGNASNKTIAWSVTPGTGTASINGTGLLDPTTVGTVTVVATNVASGVTGTKQITITAAPIPVTSITVTGAGNAVTALTGTNLQMSAAVLPADATDATVTWSVTAGTGTATINGSGLLTPTGVGTVTVVATANDDSEVTGSLQITISAPIAVTSITVTAAGNVTTTAIGTNKQMSAAVLPANASNPAVTWSIVAGTGSATISAGGLMTPSTAGTITVRATSVSTGAVVGNLAMTIYAGPGFIVSGATQGTLGTLASPTITSSKASATAINVPFFANGYTISSMTIAGVTMPAAEYTLNAANNTITLNKGTATYILRATATTVGAKALVLKLSNSTVTTYTFYVNVTA